MPDDIVLQKDSKIARDNLEVVFPPPAAHSEYRLDELAKKNCPEGVKAPAGIRMSKSGRSAVW